MSVSLVSNLYWKIGCLGLSSAVVLSAYGAHKPYEEDRRKVFETASKYHFYSSFGLLLCSIKNARLAGLLVLLGGGVFSGVAYYRVFKNDKKYNYLMPYGGGSLIISFLVLAFSN